MGFEDWAYEMIPKPHIGVIFNFPIKPEHAAYVKKEEEEIKAKG